MDIIRPASNMRNAGGAGCRLVSSSETRLAISVFSLQVETNSRYYCRLSKKRGFPLGNQGMSRRVRQPQTEWAGFLGANPAVRCCQQFSPSDVLHLRREAAYRAARREK